MFCLWSRTKGTGFCERSRFLDARFLCSYSLPQLLQVNDGFFLPPIFELEVGSFSYQRQVSSRPRLWRSSHKIKLVEELQPSRKPVLVSQN